MAIDVQVDDDDDLGQDILAAIEDHGVADSQEPSESGESEGERLAGELGEDDAEAPEGAEEEGDGDSEPDDNDEAGAVARDRDEKGRFAKEQAAKEQVSVDPLGTKGVEPPSFLTAEEKAAWGTIPATAQTLVDKIVQRRNLDVQRHLTSETRKLANVKQQFAKLDAAFRPHVERLKQEGNAPEMVIDRLLDWDSKTKQDPVTWVPRLVHSMLEETGLTLRDLDWGMSNPVPQREIVRTDPQVEERLARIEQGQTQAFNDFLQKETSSFASEKDESGQAKRPYFEQVRAEMGILVARLGEENPQWGPRELMQEAYDQAVWMNPSIRANLIKAQKETEAKAQAVKAKDAKAASSSLRNGKPVIKSPVKDPDSIEESIRRAMREHGAR